MEVTMYITFESFRPSQCQNKCSCMKKYHMYLEILFLYQTQQMVISCALQ